MVQKQSGTNTVKVAEAIKARLEEIRPALPPDIEIVVIKDQSRFIEKSIEEVKFHLLLAAVLVSATILLFIRDWRTTVIATLAIPTSIVPTFLFMQAMGFTLNNITMLGLILAIGIVIDDAVVVHENIFRHMEEDGMDGMEASRVGTREIALPVLATSLSLIVIFVPIAFMGGIVGRFFMSFGLTVAFAVAMSLFVSFTLTPMLCSRFLKLEPGEHGHAKSKSGFFYRIIDGSYGWFLRWSLRLKPLVVLLTIGVILSTGPIAKVMGVALIPRDDQSEYEVSIIAPEGYTLDRTDRVMKEIESRLRGLKGSEHVFTTVGEVVRRPQHQGRGRRHPRDDLRPDGRPDEARLQPVRRPAAGARHPPRLPRPPHERQRRLVVPERATVADVPGQHGRARTSGSSRSTPTSSRPGSRSSAASATSTRRSRSASPRSRSPSTARPRATWASRSARSRAPSASSSAARRSRSSRKGTSSTTSGSAPGPPTATRPATSTT